MSGDSPTGRAPSKQKAHPGVKEPRQPPTATSTRTRWSGAPSSRPLSGRPSTCARVMQSVQGRALQWQGNAAHRLFAGTLHARSESPTDEGPR
jgi:hypothetical protein